MSREAALAVVETVLDKREEELVDLRRDLHAHPELSWDELRTTDLVSEIVKRFKRNTAHAHARGGHRQHRAPKLFARRVQRHQYHRTMIKWCSRHQRISHIVIVMPKRNESLGIAAICLRHARDRSLTVFH